MTGKTTESSTEAGAVEANPADSQNDNNDVKTTKAESSSAASGNIKRSNKKSFPVAISLAFLLILILFAGLGVGAYFGWQFWLTQNDRIEQLETGSTEQSQQLQQFSQRSKADADSFKKQQSNLAQLQKDQRLLQERLDSHTQRLRALAGTSREDWLLAEARYLLRLANQRMLVEQGTVGAQSLLAAADKILVSMDNSDLLPVRDAIAKEMIALKLASSVDKQGLYLELAAIKQSIQSLPYIPKRPEAFEENPSESSTKTDINQDELNWHQRLFTGVQSALDGMKQYVDIIPHDQVPVLLIDDAQKAQIINNLSLMFEQAQFALLHEQDKIYQSSLQQAIDWWQVYYSHYNEYEVINSELKKLAKISIVQNLPDISRSSKLLTDYIERFHKLNASSSNAGSTSEQESAQ